MFKLFPTDIFTPSGAFTLALTAERPPSPQMTEAVPLSPREYDAVLKTLSTLKECRTPWETNLKVQELGWRFMNALNDMTPLGETLRDIVQDLVWMASYGGVPDAAVRIKALVSTWGDAFVLMRDRAVLLSQSLTHGSRPCKTRIVAIGDDGYPPQLAARLRGDAPPFLCVAGDVCILRGTSHSILGAETPKLDDGLKGAVQSALKDAAQSILNAFPARQHVVVTDGTEGVGDACVAGALDSGGNALVFTYGGLPPALQAQFERRPECEAPGVAFVSDRSFAELLPEAVYAVQPPTSARRPGALYDEREARCLQLVLAHGESTKLIGVRRGDKVHAAAALAQDMNACGKVSCMLSDEVPLSRPAPVDEKSGVGEICISDGEYPYCAVDFPTGILDGPVHEVLAAMAAILGGAALDNCACGLFDSSFESRLEHRGGIKKHERVDLAELLRMGLAAFKDLPPRMMKNILPSGYILNAYRDREDPYKVLIVLMSDVLGLSPSNECGCYAARLSLEDPDWSERVEGLPALSPRVLFLACGKAKENWRTDEYGCYSDEPFTARELPPKIMAEVLKAFYEHRKENERDVPDAETAAPER